MKLIVGLGNPGRDYAQTRHNAGFMVLERLARQNGLAGAKTRFHAGVLDGHVAGQRCLLLKPMTYMNRSGLAVGEAVNFYKADPADDLLIVVDDVALPVGRIRLRAEGSAGGHNGLADIERVLTTRAYPRLRIGIGPTPPRVPQKDYVLARFSPDQRDELEPALDRAADCIESWLSKGVAQTMSMFNARS